MIIVLVPAGMSQSAEASAVKDVVSRLQRRRTRVVGDDQLEVRAAALAKQYLGGRAYASSVRWVSNQNTRWGSCSVQSRAIRLSDKARGFPAYVIDYLLLHELTHLLVPGHGPQFWALVGQFPATERARGFLEGAAVVSRQPISEDGEQDEDVDTADEQGTLPEQGTPPDGQLW